MQSRSEQYALRPERSLWETVARDKHAWRSTNPAVLKFRQDLIAGKLSFDNLSSLFKTQSWQQFVKRTDKEKRLFFSDPDAPIVQNKADDSDDILDILQNVETTQTFKKAFSKLSDKCLEV